MTCKWTPIASRSAFSRYCRLNFPVALIYVHFRHFCVHLNFIILMLDLIYVSKISQKNVVKSNQPHITYTSFTGMRLLTIRGTKLKAVVTRKLPRDQEQLKGRITAPTSFPLPPFLFPYKVCLPSLPSSLSCSLVCSFLEKIWKPNICHRPAPHHLLVTEVT